MAAYDVANRSAIVTGGASGIGRATARLLAASGASVLITDINAPLLHSVVDEIIAAGGKAVGLVGDVTDREHAFEAVRKAGELAPLGIAINNAGIGGSVAAAADYPMQTWDEVLAVNVTGVMNGMQAQLPALVANGGGSIVNTGSIASSIGVAMSSAYITSKHAVLGLSKAAALDYAAQGVRINSVGPGFILTPLVEDNMDADMLRYTESKHPIGRLGKADEVAAVIAFLASDAASFVTGSHYPVDGGYLAQ